MSDNIEKYRLCSYLSTLRQHFLAAISSTLWLCFMAYDKLTGKFFKYSAGKNVPLLQI